ncbi:MAG: DUF4097 family beta strand repeat protein [Gemmatimonas sp.]|nr:DUF4097 family beta strand repeat protein [Gemmatimonas sp.]
MISHFRRLATAVFAVPVALTLTSHVAMAQRTTAEPFAWEGSLVAGQTLEIKGVNGSIDAVPTTNGTARVEAVRSGRRNDPNEVEIAVVEHAGGATICAVYPSSGSRANECLPGDAGRISSRRNDVQVEFTVAVPDGVALVANTTNGSIEAEGLTGPIVAHSTNGDVRVEGGARVIARTTNGSITIASAGEADARTTNGQITARLGSMTSTDPLDFRTTNGSITLDVPPDANFDIDASTSNGGIETALPITVQGRLGRNNLTGRIGSGGREVRLRTTNGRISIESGV